MDNSLTATEKIRTSGDINRRIDNGESLKSPPMPGLTEGAGGTGIPANPWSQKYHYRNGTHCWYCDREISTSSSYRGGKLKRTADHIIPKRLVKNIHRNAILACHDCNELKAWRTVNMFGFMAKKLTKGTPLAPYYHTIKQRALKLFNKTSWAHKAL